MTPYFLSIHTLEPGDIVATGTNHRGLSGFQDGDKIELEVEKCGKLTINVKDDLKRTWGNSWFKRPGPLLLPGTAARQ